MTNDKNSLNFYVKPEVPLSVSIALLLTICIFFTSNLAALDIPLHYKLIFIVAEIIVLLNIGLLMTRSFNADAAGLTVTWFGLIRRKYSWSYFKEVGVYILGSTYGRAPFIVCSKFSWPKKILISDLSFFFPFSCFFIDFTPKRFDVIKKLGVDIVYYSSREKVIEMYIRIQEEQKKRKTR